MMRAGVWLGRMAVTTVALVWFFRRQFDNRFTVLFGNPDDAVITTSLIEHWHRVFAGLDRWNQVPYFAPHADTLGYGEGFFLLGMIAAPLRAAGIDPFVAAELGTLVMRGVGGICFAVLAQRVFLLSLPVSLLGAFLVTAAGNALVQADHAQLATTLLLPPFALLIANAVRAVSERTIWRAAGWACAAAVLLDAWLLTAFYTAWFAILFLLVMAAVWFARRLLVHGPRLQPGAASLRPFLLPTALVAIAGVSGAIPFLVAYLPRAAETGMHDFAKVRPNLPSLPGLLNDHLGFGLIGRLPSGIATAIAHANTDPAGYAPLLLLLSLAGFGLSVAGNRHADRRAAPVALWLSLGIATAACLLLVTTVPAWHLVYRLVPGAKVVRAPARFLLLLSLPLVLLAMLTLDRLYQRFGRGSLPILLVLALALVAEEQASPPVGMPRAPGDRLIADLPAAPGTCRSFFVTGHDPNGWHTIDDAPNYRHNADAMFVAVMTGLPTINGYSTFNPPDWDFADVESPNYLDRIGKYADAHHLSPSLCQLDLSTLRWTAHPMLPMPVIEIGQTVSLSNADPLGSRFTLAGWGSSEENGRWTVTDHASFRFLVPGAVASDTLRFSMRGSALLQGVNDGSDRVRIVANGRSLGIANIGAAPGDVSVLVPAGTVGPDGALTITLLQPPLRTPRDLGIAPDDRRLGLYVWWIRIDRSL